VRAGWCGAPRKCQCLGGGAAAQLDDVDLGNRRLIIAGRVRPIDEFTRQILPDWLGCRRTR
jgi:hypothetical protein